MLLVYTHKITPRLTYVFKHICERILQVDVSFTSKIEDFIAHNSIKISYTKQPLSHEFFIKSHSLLFDTGVADIQINPLNWDTTKCFFTTNERSNLPFDIFAASFYLLSRYEEYLPSVRDNYGRFMANQSIAYKYNFLHQPVVDIWAYKFKEALQKRFSEYQFLERQYNVQPVIDVPMAYYFKHKGLMRTIGGTLSNLVHLKFKLLYQRYLVLLNIKTDPYYTFKWLIKQQKKCNFKFLVLFLIGEYSTYDKNINTNKKQFVTLIKDVADYCKVGLKASYLALHDVAILKKEKLKLEKIIHRDLQNIRHSYSKLNLPQSYRNLVTLEIHNDYTMGYYNTLGFRAGSCTPFFYYDLDYEAQTPLQIHPYQCMDFALLKHTSLLDKTEHLKQIMAEVKAVNGVFTVVFHNYSFSNFSKWKGFKNLFKLIINSADA